MRTIAPREWQRLEYFDAREVLVRLAKLEGSLSGPEGDARATHTPQQAAASYSTRRLAALFCYGMSCLIGRPVSYAPVESEEFDCVARWMAGKTPHYMPVKLKELPAGGQSPGSALNAELAAMAKHGADSQLCVAVYLNRDFRLDPATLRIPDLSISELWAFGAVVPDKSRWMLWGNLLASPTSIEYAYPA